MKKVMILPLFLGVLALYAAPINFSSQRFFTLNEISSCSGIMDQVLEEAALEFFEVYGISITFEELKTEWENGTTTITQEGSTGTWRVTRGGGGIVIVSSENSF